MYENKLKFPGGRWGAKQKIFRGGSMDIFWNCTFYVYFPQAFQDLWTNERLLNVVEQFIGPDIAGHPVWNLRTKVSV